MYTCPVCGKEYCSTPQAEKDGWGCPYCSLSISVHDRFNHLVETIGHGEYRALDEFQQLNQKLRFYHNACGKETMIAPKDFLFQNKRCSCERRISFEKAKETVESIAGFQLLEFKGYSEPAKIYHEKCGHVFQCEYHNFVRAPKCRFCESPVTDTEIFKNRMKDLVGDEYTLIGEYVNEKTKVTIRHNVCNTTHEYFPNNFLKGQRCSNCNNRMYYKDYKRMLEEYSGGKYIITEFKKSRVCIQNVETKEIIVLTQKQLVQEILRPTPSPLLPVSTQSDSIHDLNVAWDQWYDLLVEYKKEFGTTNVPHDAIYKDHKLGLWCNKQRDAFKKNRMPQRRILKLEDIGFVWDIREYLWNKKYNLCKRYLLETGAKKIMRSTVFEGDKIGAWLSQQRINYNAGKLSKERAQKLLNLYPDILS